MSESPFEVDLRSAARDAWARFLVVVDPFRPDLFRYCRRLTGNVWDAEDLIQDTLEQAFARLGTLHTDVASPKGYVLRIASHLWIDRVRRETAGRDPGLGERSDEESRSGDRSHRAARAHEEVEQPLRVREAAERMLSQLAPQEQAALVLKEVFQQSLEEIAGVLGTSTGAIKAALHRGRTRLEAADENTPARRPVSRAVLEQFVERFNARDRDGLLALMLDDAAIRMAGVDYEIGHGAFTREPGWLYYNLLNPHSRWEVAEFRHDLVVLVGRKGDDAVTSVMRLDTVDERVASIRVYAFCPDTVREVAAALGRPAAPGGWYRFDPETLRLPR